MSSPTPDQPPTDAPKQVAAPGLNAPPEQSGSPQEDSEEEEPTATPHPTICVAWPTQEAGDPDTKCIVSFSPETTPVYTKVKNELRYKVEDAEERARKEAASGDGTRDVSETSVARETLNVAIRSRSRADDPAIERWLKDKGLAYHSKYSNEGLSLYNVHVPVLLVGELAELEAVKSLSWNSPVTAP